MKKPEPSSNLPPRLLSSVRNTGILPDRAKAYVEAVDLAHAFPDCLDDIIRGILDGLNLAAREGRG